MSTKGKWHINKKGEAGQCEAEKSCPFGEFGHNDTQEQARAAYDKSMSGLAVAAPISLKHKKKSLKEIGSANELILKKRRESGTRFTGLEIAQRKDYIEKALSKLIEMKKTTEDLYSTVSSVTGQRVYTPERARVHQELVESIIQDAMKKGVKREGKALFSGGLGGAGKTTVLTMYSDINNDDYVTVNPDDIKELMAEKGYIKRVLGLTPMESSPLAHEEASHISQILLQRVAQEKMNIIIDITMANAPKVQKRAESLRAHGYSSIEAIFVDITPETSVQRAETRYEVGMNSYVENGNGQGGRYLPSYAMHANFSDDPNYKSNNAKNLIALHKAGVFDAQPKIYDNDGRQPIEVDFSEFSGSDELFV